MAKWNGVGNESQTSSCPVTGGGCDKLSCLLSKVGVTRSLLITLAVIPFAWKGVVLCATGLEAIWHVLTDAVTTVTK